MRLKGRIYIAGAIALFVLAAGLVPAAGAKRASKPQGSPMSCRVTVTTEIPSGQTAVEPAAAQGDQWGSIQCGKKLGDGAQKQFFSSFDSGVTTGTFTSWLGQGTLRGKFSLTQQEGSLSAGTAGFASASYAGTIKVTGGHGTLKGAKGKGTLTCTTPDGLHFTCSEKLSLRKL